MEVSGGAQKGQLISRARLAWGNLSNGPVRVHNRKTYHRTSLSLRHLETSELWFEFAAAPTQDIAYVSCHFTTYKPSLSLLVLNGHSDTEQASLNGQCIRRKSAAGQRCLGPAFGA